MQSLLWLQGLPLLAKVTLVYGMSVVVQDVAQLRTEVMVTVLIFDDICILRRCKL